MHVISFNELLLELKKFSGNVQNVVIATYGKIHGFEDGQHTDTSISGKTIKVFVGGGMFTGINLGFVSIPSPNPDLVQETKDKGLEAMGREVSNISDGTFVVLYAGKSRLNKVIDLGASLAEKGIKVALLSCGCDKAEVFTRVDGLPGADNIIIVIPDHHPHFCDSEAEDLGVLAKKSLQL